MISPEMPVEVVLRHALKPEKKKDVKMLLRNYAGEEWRGSPKLQWYTRILSKNFNADCIDDPSISCDCEEHDSGLKL